MSLNLTFQRQFSRSYRLVKPWQEKKPLWMKLHTLLEEYWWLDIEA
jgi:hypothetical protein